MVKVDIGAKAEAKLHIKGEVPSSSLGRFVDSFTDMIRPFSEARGLKADLLRMQREDVAFEIAQRALRRLALEQGEIHAVPTKILAPLIEKGSCEDSDSDDMIERWANLLASAALQVPVEPRFVAILGELSGAQALMLDRISFNGADQANFPYRCLADASIVLSDQHLRLTLQKIISSHLSSDNPADLLDVLESNFKRPGSVLWYANVVDGAEYYYVDYLSSIEYSEHAEMHVSILESLGLIKLVSLELEKRNKKSMSSAHVQYYHLTETGFYFVQACSRSRISELRKVDEVSSANDKQAEEYFSFAE